MLGSYTIRENCVGMVHQTQRRDSGAHGSFVGINKNMSRELRHGTRRDEAPIPMDLADGGSILAATLIEQPTFQRLHTQRADVTPCASEKDEYRKSRFGLLQAPGGERLRAYQGRSPNVIPPDAHNRLLERHFLLHAANLRAAATIHREGFILQQSGRSEFHFSDRSFNKRQSQYLRDSSGRKGVWILFDSRIASRLGCRFRFLPNDVVGDTGNVGRIDKQRIASVSETKTRWSKWMAY